MISFISIMASKVKANCRINRMKYAYRMILSFSLCTFISNLVLAQLSFEQVLINGRDNPLGINTASPQFSWRLKSNEYDVEQQGFRISIFEDSNSSQTCVWDSGWKASNQSLSVDYEGTPLLAGHHYQYQIEVKDNKGNEAKSRKGHFLVGLLHAKDWGTSKWIGKEALPASMINTLPLSSSKFRIDQSFELPVFRKTFEIKKKLKRSIAYISGLGHFELLLNGIKVDDTFLQPGWTKYDKEALYVVLDLTQKMQLGKNSFGILLGNGFYYIPPIKGRYQKHKVAFGLPKVRMKVVNQYTDGSEEIIETDTSWKVHRSPITFSSMYSGEDYDEHILNSDWSKQDFNDQDWENAIEVSGPSLSAQETNPVRVMQEFEAVDSFRLAKNRNKVYDFGQNASGIISIELDGCKGDTIRIYPAELLSKDSTVNQKATGSPYYYQYIFQRDGKVKWQPRFTYYGFRYAQVALLSKEPRELDIKAIKALHIRNAAERVGSFHTSDSLFNQVHRLIKWAINSNMVSVFTDCPHREKLGWLEQLHLMGPSIQYNYDVERLFAKSLRDMRMSQTADGLVPEIAPEFVQFDWGGDMFRDSPEWGSSSIILAWYAYRWYGNKAFLTDNYDMMKRYIQYLHSKANHHILTQGLGDWYDLGPERPGVSQLTTKGITATAIYYYDLSIMVKIASLLGRVQDELTFKKLQENVFEAFNKTFYNPKTHTYGSGSQTALAMPLYVGLVPMEDREHVFEQLVNSIAQVDTALTSGDIGHRYVLKSLQEKGRDDLIYAMHHNDNRPGYGYQIKKGATALTESWAALPNVSNNHFMLGHLMEWFHTGIGGIEQEAYSTAFKHFRIAPKLFTKIQESEIEFRSPYGWIRFQRHAKPGRYHLEVPVNSTCTLVLPLVGNYLINGKPLKSSRMSSTADDMEITLGSGKYTITQ